MGVGDFDKLFYVRKEEIAIFPLMPEELNSSQTSLLPTFVMA